LVASWEPALVVEQCLPICGHAASRSRHGLICRMGVGRGKNRSGKEVAGTVIVKPPFPGLETRDYRVTGRRIVLRCVLIWRGIAAANVTALGASAKMQPPAAHRQAFDTACTARLG
jgi:hypothetical protein